MNTETIIIAVLGSNAAGGAVLVLIGWGWRRFFARVDAGRSETLTALQALSTEVHEHAEQSRLHQEQDTALFTNHGNRLSRAEGSIDVLTQIVAARGIDKP